jgi:outer membrane protein OmpA-like peptidoglycan-associated protein
MRAPEARSQEVYFDYNSAEITSKAEPQLDELGTALADPKLKGAKISINGHTDGVGGDAFNKKLSEHRAAMIKEYLVDNFQLSPSNLRTIGYGKTRLKNKMDPNAPENRRVEVVNETPRTQAQRWALEAARSPSRRRPPSSRNRPHRLRPEPSRKSVHTLVLVR